MLLRGGGGALPPDRRTLPAGAFRAIAAKGYSGFLGLEMWPTVDHAKAVREAIAMLAEATTARR